MFVYKGGKDLKAPTTQRTARLVSAGTVSHYNTDKMTIRKSGREDWSLFFCVEGSIYFDEIKLDKGQIWIYPPRVPQQYVAYKKDNTVYRFIHFTGKDIDTLFGELNIKPFTPIVPKKDFSAEIIKEIISVQNFNDSSSLLKGEYLLLRLFSFLIGDEKKPLQQNHNIKLITDYMEHSYFEPYDAKRFSKMLNISESRFNHLFKEQTGISPKGYYSNIRIDNACRLLESTSLKINEISARVGYDDPLHFGQIFKKFKGLSPRAYRDIYKISRKDLYM